MTGAARYTFGDDAAAAERLRRVADAYRPTSAAFVRAAAPSAVSVAVDLGCGPGFSTELLGEECRPTRLIGLDASPEFVGWAGRRVRGAEFAVHDAATTPLPCGPADVLYARLLLAHLADPVETVGRWRRELAPGGVLLVEDLDGIEAPPGPLRDYEALSTDVVRAGGGTMYGGQAVAGLGGKCVEVRVPVATAASIYLVNVVRWRTDPPAATALDPGHLGELAGALGRLADGGGEGTVAWLVRQVALSAR